MIDVRDLSVHVGTFALDGVTLQVPTGTYAVLMGQTGAGKTTLLEALCGLRPVRSGRITFADRDVTTERAAKRGVGYVPQDLGLFPSLSVRQHLAFALEIRHWSKAAIAHRVAELADMFRLSALLDRKPAGLSGGEAQRVALGRALAHQPAVLLLDEPLSALDSVTHAESVELFRALRSRFQVTTLHVTHNVHEAKALADQLLVLRAGAVHSARISEHDHFSKLSVSIDVS